MVTTFARRVAKTLRRITSTPTRSTMSIDAVLALDVDEVDDRPPEAFGIEYSPALQQRMGIVQHVPSGEHRPSLFDRPPVERAHRPSLFSRPPVAIDLRVAPVFEAFLERNIKHTCTQLQHAA